MHNQLVYEGRVQDPTHVQVYERIQAAYIVCIEEARLLPQWANLHILEPDP